MHLHVHLACLVEDLGLMEAALAISQVPTPVVADVWRLLAGLLVGEQGRRRPKLLKCETLLGIHVIDVLHRVLQVLG